MYFCLDETVVTVEKSSSAKKKGATNTQRYFRVPFSKPSDQFRDADYKKTGWW